MVVQEKGYSPKTHGPMLTFDGPPGAVGCKDCAKYVGQRHSTKWWADRGLLARDGNTNYECGRWKTCNHDFFTDDGDMFDAQTWAHKEIAEKAVAATKGYNPSEARAPAGGPGGGQWVGAGGASGALGARIAKAKLRQMIEKEIPHGNPLSRKKVPLSKLERATIVGAVIGMTAALPPSAIAQRMIIDLAGVSILSTAISHMSPSYRKWALRLCTAAMIVGSVKGLMAHGNVLMSLRVALLPKAFRGLFALGTALRLAKVSRDLYHGNQASIRALAGGGGVAAGAIPTVNEIKALIGQAIQKETSSPVIDDELAQQIADTLKKWDDEMKDWDTRSTVKGFNPGQPRDPAGSPTGGRWASAAGGIRSAIGKVRGKVGALAKNPRIMPQGPVFAPNGETTKLTKIERIAINQGIKQMMSHVGIQNKVVLVSLGIAANFMIPRLISRLSPTYRKMAMSVMYGALVKAGIDVLSTVLTLANAARHGTLEADVKSALDAMNKPTNMTQAEFDALVNGYTGKEAKNVDLEELAAKVADLCTKWMKEEIATDAKKQASVFTSKEADGKYRWTIIGSGAYGPDRDGEWMTEKALRGWADSFIERGGTIPVRSNGESVALRWWHVGKPDTDILSKGPGIDLGVCDFAAVHSKSLVLSGTFDDPEVGRVISEKADRLGASIGYFHPQYEPVDKEFHTIDVYEVSLLPVERASYPFTGLTVLKGN